MNLGTSIKGKKHLWKNVKEEKSPIKIRQFKFIENVLLLLFICCISLPLENAVKKYGAFMRQIISGEQRFSRLKGDLQITGSLKELFPP